MFPLGAVDLDGAVMVALEDPDDGLRSTSPYWVLLPGATLRTQIPGTRVRAQRSDCSDWDWPERNERTPSLMDLVSTHTGNVLVSMGTKYGDDLYPVTVFRHDPVAIDLAAAKSTDEILSLSTAQVPAKHRPRKRSRL